MGKKYSATSTWNGTLKEGNGEVNLPKANITTPYDFKSRFESGNTTNPEELLAGAISACFSMYLSALFSNETLTNTNVTTTANVTLDAEQSPPKITTVELNIDANAPSLSNDRFNELVQQTEQECPVANLFTGATVRINAAVMSETS